MSSSAGVNYSSTNSSSGEPEYSSIALLDNPYHRTAFVSGCIYIIISKPYFSIKPKYALSIYIIYIKKKK